MKRNSDDTIRRLFNFPAIRPCESVSFSTLLSSLINLGVAIVGFKSRKFFTNKRKAKNSIRLIQGVVIFLQEIRPLNGPSSLVVLCLSELHYLFQKLKFLLEDCTRDDSRLWVISKSDVVATHFHVLMRAIGVALDVLPSSSLDVADEAKELAEFVKKQSRKSVFEVEEDDNRIRRKMLEILHQFEDGITPESSELKRVLEYLGIRSWNDCYMEFKFLNSEEFSSSDSETKDLDLLNSLMAFIAYCRCTLFAAVENTRNPVSQQCDEELLIREREMITSLNPDDFRCPISLDFMTDPVAISSGHTYDRSSILKWFRCGNHTCPKTGERLHCLSLVPNLVLKRLTKLYCHENRIPFPEPGRGGRKREQSDAPVVSYGLTANNAMKLVSSFLVSKLVDGTMEEQLKSAYEIYLLTKTSGFNRSCLVEADAIPPLLNLVSAACPEIQKNAVASVLNLSKYSGTRAIVVENGGLEKVVKALNEGLTIKARQHAAGIIFYLASVEDNRRTIGRIPSAIPGLMILLREGSDRGKKNALVTIFGLLLSPENHWRMLSAGLVLLLVDTLRSSRRDDLTADCLAVLASLGDKPDGATAIFTAGALPFTMEIMGSSNSRGPREYGVSLLLALCNNNEKDVVPVLAKNNSLMGSLYTVLVDGSPWARKKASSLIRILQTHDEKSSMESTLPQENLVHAW
ncbi:hypothetical protein M569_02773 [Genlisea aurea]|uniref:RING-type E3 ubiquitin transferase n=1 Tax=Genlisea aurea TaxID=192259 RepID=S8D3K1_9LAMI|nr:hypothetical protein M569_02773 [Genlisea aurea]